MTNNRIVEARFSLVLTELGLATVSSVSDGVSSLLGYGPEEFLSARVALTDLIHPEDRDIVDALFNREATKDTESFNIRIRQVNGRIRLIRGEYTKRPSDARTDVTLELLLQDAKSLPRTLEDASKTDNFRAMMENTDDFIFFKDRNHVFTGASQTLVSLCATAEHWTDLIGQTDYDVFPEEYADIYYRLEKQIFSGITVAHEIQETLSTDGKKGWVDNRKYPVRDPNGKIIGLYGIARDITDLKSLQTELEKNNIELEKRVEERTVAQAAIQHVLEEQNERFKMASDAASLGFWDYDIVSNTLKWDDRMYRIYGRSRLDGDQPYDLWAKNVHPDDLIRSEKELNEAIEGIRNFNTEFRIFHPDGTIRYIKAIAYAARDANGNAIKMFGINFDITEVKLAERRQKQLVEQLTRINEELNNFAYVASHDLKSPLRGIDQLATWITEDLGDTLSRDTQEHLRLMRSRIHRMEMLLDDLLAYSRVGRTDGEVVEVNTHELVQDIFDLAAASTDMHLIVSDNMPVLLTKKVPLELIFRNLIGNAIKHHDKAQGTISISAHPATDGFEFEVKDDGPGIPLEHQQRVFAMFQTLKPRDEIEGSGIGLALVKKAIESVGGTITLESDGHHGCTFRFTWPTNHPEGEMTA